ncbi:MAG: hypothetical protein JXA72_11270, partial [Bacteroidales bacterium]|nr:hypothetical protein [Bacteroidales bacterium]
MKLYQTSSNNLKPYQTLSNSIKPHQTLSNFIKQSQTNSNSIKPACQRIAQARQASPIKQFQTVWFQ